MNIVVKKIAQDWILPTWWWENPCRMQQGLNIKCPFVGRECPKWFYNWMLVKSTKSKENNNKNQTKHKGDKMQIQQPIASKPLV